MTNTATERYEDWKAPPQDGGVLLWPGKSDRIAWTRENQRLLSTASVRIQGIALSELRSKMREWIGHADSERPIIATGHQTELYHPGVWVKNVAIDQLAKEMGGEAYQFGVDTDEPKHLNLRWPAVSLPVSDDPAINTAAWSGLVSGPTPGHLQQLEDKLRDVQTTWGYQPVAGEFLSSMKKLTLEEPSLPKMLMSARS